METDFQSRSVMDSSKWKLNPLNIQNDLQGSRDSRYGSIYIKMSDQLSMYIAQKPDLFSTGVDAFQKSCRNPKGYAVPPFCLIRKILRKAHIEMATIILITPACLSQTWYSTALQMSLRYPVLILRTDDLLFNPKTQKHPLVINKTPQLVARVVSKKSFLQDYQNRLSHSFQMPEGKV